MTNEEMLAKAKRIVVEYFNSHSDATDGVQINESEVFIVWFCKTLQNWKALVSTVIPDGIYYEITHNGDRDTTYVDVYKKWENFSVKDYGSFQEVSINRRR